MPKRIYSADEYLKGLEAQGIVVHDAMRNTVKRLNPQGVIEGHAPIDDQANPLLPDDPRYEAGHADKVREAQERIEAFRISEAEEARRQSAAIVHTWDLVNDHCSCGTTRNQVDDNLAPNSCQLAMRQVYVRNRSPEAPLPLSVRNVQLTRSELAALIQHLAASGHSAQRVAELAALLV